MVEQKRFPREGWVPIAAGLTWLWCAASFGVVGFFFSLVPGCLLLASGVSMLLYPGDLRIPQFAALGGVLGVPLRLARLLRDRRWLALLSDRALGGLLRRGGRLRGRHRRRTSRTCRRRGLPPGSPPRWRSTRRSSGPWRLSLPMTRPSGARPRARRRARWRASCSATAAGSRSPPTTTPAAAARLLRAPPGRDGRHGSPSSTCASQRLRARRRTSPGARPLLGGGEPHRPRLGRAPARPVAPVADLHPRLPDGHSAHRPPRLRSGAPATTRAA